MTTIDFGKLMQDAGEGFQPVPTGPYNVQVVKSTAVTASTGKPMIKVQLQIMGGPSDGRRLFDQFVISADNPNALSFFFEHMAAFGLDRSFFASNPSMEAVAATLMNRQALVSVSIKQFKGSDRNEVDSYRPIMGGQIGAPAVAPTFGPSTAPPPVVAPPPVAPPVAPPMAPVIAPVAAPVAPVAPAPVAPAPVAPVAPPIAAPAAPVAPPIPAPIVPPAAIVPPPAAIAPPAPVAAPVAPALVQAPAPVQVTGTMVDGVFVPDVPAPVQPVAEVAPVAAPVAPPAAPVFTGDAEPF